MRSGEDIATDRWEIDCALKEVPHGVRDLIADRLFDDRFVCEAVVNDEGTVEPRVTDDEPDLICVDGIELRDLVDAVLRDQREVEEYMAELAAKKESAVA